MKLKDFTDSYRVQTVGVVNDKAFIEPLVFFGIKGIYRVVRNGRTMDFDLIWDGYSLCERITRQIGV